MYGGGGSHHPGPAPSSSLRDPYSMSSAPSGVPANSMRDPYSMGSAPSGGQAPSNSMRDPYSMGSAPSGGQAPSNSMRDPYSMGSAPSGGQAPSNSMRDPYSMGSVPTGGSSNPMRDPYALSSAPSGGPSNSMRDPYALGSAPSGSHAYSSGLSGMGQSQSGMERERSLHHQSSVVGPAPSSARSHSVGPTGLHLQMMREGGGGYTQTQNRKQLTRQHRSMDMVGGYDDFGGSGDIHAPLSIATGYGQPQTSSYSGMRHSGPLSNPTSTTQQYWGGGGTGRRYIDDNLGGGLSLQQEFEQLKSDYAANLEKLNQTMHSIKTFWSPELKRERQMRREEANRIAQLERMLAAAGGSAASVVGGNAALQMEIGARDDRIRQLSAMLDDQNQTSLMTSANEIRLREMEQTVAHLQEMLKQAHSGDASGRYALESALRRIDEKTERIQLLEDELNRFRLSRSQQPRDFTDKSVTSHELVTLRLKMERSEMELSERKQELATCQTRLRNCEDESNDMKGHLQLIREQNMQKEQQNTLLQGDVEALRAKLEAKHQAIEQRDSRIDRLEKELNGTKGESNDRLENMRQTDMRMSQMVGRVDGLENSLREKEAEIDRMKQRLAAHPDVQKEKEFLARIEQGDRERQRLEQLVDQVRRTGDKERQQQLETYQAEANQMKANIENLQKEMADRDVLLESQNEKIGDMGRELAAAEQRLSSAMVDKGTDELRKEVESARSEVDKLLRMVRGLEKENATVISQYKQLQGTVDREGTVKVDGRTGLALSSPAHQHATYTKRIEELEEALRESVSITAERELHLSQQKHVLQQVNQQFSDTKRECQEMKRRLSEMGGSDREGMMRSLEAERRQHIEQLLLLKQEALMAAVAEKDAHLALLEKGRANREEIETVRRHKEALLTKLKQENERRAMMMRADSTHAVNLIGQAVMNSGPTIGVGAPILPLSSSSHPIHGTSHNAPIAMLGPPSKPPSRAGAYTNGDPMATSGEIDDTEGIWA